MTDLEKTLFYKPTGTIQIANKFSLVERKLLNAIIWHSQKNHFKTQELSIPVREIFSLIGLEKSRNNDILKDALRMLTGTIIEWNNFGVDKVTEWGVCTFLASGKIVSGKLFYRLNPELIKQINQPTLYAKIQLLIQGQVKKRHALVLYEFFLDALSRVKKDALNLVTSLEQLFQLLGANEDMTYKIFNRDIIKPSIKEISQHTDIDVACSTNRKGRQVAEIVFHIAKKNNFQLSIDFDAVEGEDEKAEKLLIEYDEGEPDLLELLKFHGITEKKAKELVESFDRERIQGNIDYLLEQQRQGKAIANTQAYLVKAIEEDFRPKKSPKEALEEKQKQQKASAAAKAKQAKAQKEQQESEWKRFCEQRLKDNFAGKPEDWQEEKRQNFIVKIKATNPILYNSYKKDAFNSPMVQAVFYSELRDELLTAPEETSLAHYLNGRGTLQSE